MNIATLISGGVDSSVVVHLLKESGYTPTLFYIKIGADEEEGLNCTSEEDIEMATLVARKYGCPLEIIDLHREYWDSVVAYTIDKVRRGNGFDKTATGHYATTTETGGKTWLSTAKDPVKDQTDFLAQIDYLQVSKLMFPIGHLMKSEVRTIAESAGIATAKRKDSQGICFLGKINYNDFIRRYLGEKEGDVIELETGKKIGHHKGFWFHTIGQRHGLGFGGGPWYVIKKDINENIIYVSKGFDAEAQYGNHFTIHDFHFITDNPWNETSPPIDITFKIRHTPEFTHGKLYKENGVYKIESSKPLQGIAAGQFGVIYDAEHQLCIGSGEIQ